MATESLEPRLLLSSNSLGGRFGGPGGPGGGPPVVDFQNGGMVVVDEGAGTISVGVTISQAALSSVTVDISAIEDSAIDGLDFNLIDDHVIFPANSTATQFFSLQIIDDSIVESAEKFSLELSTLDPFVTTGLPVEYEIMDNDSGPPLSLNVANSTVTETDSNFSHNVTVTRSGGNTANPLTVNLSATDGSAIDPGDYQLPGSSVTFAANVTTVTFPVTIVGDNIVESTENFTVTATSGAVSDSGTVTINDDDSTSALVLNVVPKTVTETDSNVNHNVTITRSGGNLSSSLTVNLNATDGTAVQTSDYLLPNSTVTFAANQTSTTFPVTIVGDNVAESQEQFTVTASSGAVSDTGTTTINDDDQNVPGTFTLQTQTFSENQGSTQQSDSSGYVDVTITRTGGSGTVTVPIVVGQNAASPQATTGVDFALIDQSVTFTGNGSMTFEIWINDDTTVEPREYFTLIPNISGGVSRQFSITDNDGTLPPTVSGSSSVTYNHCNNTGTLTIPLTVDDPDGNSSQVVVTERIDSSLTPQLPSGSFSIVGHNIIVDQAMIDELATGTYQIPLTATDEDGDTGDGVATLTITNNIQPPDAPTVNLDQVHYLTNGQTTANVTIDWTDTGESFSWAIYELSANGDGTLDASDWTVIDSGSLTDSSPLQVMPTLDAGIYSFTVDATECGLTSDEAVEYFSVMGIGFETAENTENQCSSCASHRPGEEPVPGVKATSLDGNLIVDVAGSLMDIGGRLADFARVSMLSALNPHPVAYARVQLPTDVDADLTMFASGDTSGAGGSARTSTTERDTTDTGGPVSILAPVQWGTTEGPYGLSSENINIDTTLRVPGLPGQPSEVTITATGSIVPAEAPTRDLSDSAYGRRMDVAGISYLDSSDPLNPVLYRGNGTNLVYTDSQGTFQSPEGSYTTLTTDPGNGHIVTTDIGMRYYYDTSGRLYKTISRAGDEVLIQYSTTDHNGDLLLNEIETVTDSSTGATVTYGYDGSGQLQTITHSIDPNTTNDDRTWTYQFTTSNLLQSVTAPVDPDDPTKPRAVVRLEYHTDGTHLLKSIEQSDTSNGYYGRTEFAFDEWRNLTTVTQVGDLSTATDNRVWTFSSAESRLLSGLDSWELPAAGEDVTTGPEDRITMPNGDTITREVDRFGKPIRETRTFKNHTSATAVASDSSVTAYERNANGQVEKIIGPYLASEGAVGADEQTFVYDSQRRLTSITYPDQLTESWTYVGQVNGSNRGPDQPDTFTNKLGQVTTYAYASNGHSSRETLYRSALGTPVASDSSRVFNSDGLLQVEYRHFGFSGENSGDRTAVHYYYDDMERLIHVRETTWNEFYGTPDSAKDTDRWTSFGYDEYGYLAWTTTPYRATTFGTDTLPVPPPVTLTTNYDNDVMGNPVQMTLPDPDDAGTGAARPVYNYTYDPYSRQLTEVTPLRTGQSTADATTTYTYNKFGEAETITSPAPGGPGSLQATVLRNSYTYNSDGFLVSSTQETTSGTVLSSTHAQYNALGLMLWQSDDYIGDVAAASTLVVDRNRVQYDGQGRPTKSWSPGDNIADVSINYNDATNTVIMTDAGGYAWTSVYDGIGRMTSSTTPDPAGTNAAIVTSYTYLEGSTGYRREDNSAMHGTLVSTSVSSGGQSYALQRQLIGVFGQVLMTEAGDPNGAGLQNTYTTFTYDQEGNLTATDELSGSSLTAAYADPLRRTTEFEYNVRGQQIRSLSPLPSSGLSQLETNYVYDNLGRLVKEFGAKPEDTLDAQAPGYSHGLYVETHYDYYADGLLERTEFFDKDADTSNDTYQDFTYDNLGRTLTVTGPDATNSGTAVTSYEYNQLGLLAKETLPDPAGPRTSHVTTYTYDGRTTAANAPGILLATVTAPAGNGTGTTAYAYDSHNRVESVYLPDPSTGNASGTASSKIVYDAFGRATEQHVLQSGTTASYDVVTTIYDALGRVTHTGTIANAPNVTSADSYHEYQYDALGNVETVIDPIGAETLAEYDDWGRVTAVHQLTPGGSLTSGVSDYGTVTTTYDSLGRVSTSTRAATGMTSETTTYEYDLFDRPTKVTHPSGYNEQYRYRQWGPMDRHLNQYGQPTYFNHDSAGRLISQKNQFDTNHVEFEYNAYGQVETETRHLTSTNSVDYQYKYDVLGLKTQDILPTGGIVDYEYDTAGNLISLTDATSTGAGDRNTTAWTYDRRNRVTSEQVNSTGPSKSWQYYENDTTRSFTDRNGDEREYSYDFAYGAGQKLTEEKWKVGGQYVGGRTYDYDADTGIYLEDVKTYEPVSGNALGNVLTHVNFTYDSLGRRYTTRDYLVDDGDDTTWQAVDNIIGYDGFGRRDVSAFQFTEKSSSGADLYRWDSTNYYQWDVYSRVSHVTQTLAAESTATTTGANDGSTTRGVYLQYYRNGDLHKITRSETGKLATVVSTYALANGGWIQGRIGSITHTATAGFDQANPAYSWTYEDGGRVNTRTTPDGTIDYGYDSLDQVVSGGEVDGDGNPISWSYDDSGNRTDYTVIANNRLQSDGTYTYEYDEEGRRTKRTETSGDYEAYEWDLRGLLISVTSYASGQSGTNYLTKVEYDYDGLNRRIRRKVDADGDQTFEIQQRFVYSNNVLDPSYAEVAMVLDETDDWNLLQGFPGGEDTFRPTIEQRLLNGPMLDQVFASEDANDSILWNLHDTQQSVTEVVEIGDDNSGNAGQSNIRNRITYTELGDHSETDTNFSPLQKYTGQIHDDVTGLAYYDARWYDPSVNQFISEDPIGFAAGDPNLRRYVGNGNPNRTDPSGLDWRQEEDLFRMGAQMEDLIDRINKAEGARRYREHVRVPATVFGRPQWAMTGRILYRSMELQERVWRKELEFLIQRTAILELEAGVTFEELQARPTISPDNRSALTRWLDSPADAGDLNVIGKAFGRAARGVGQGLHRLITDAPGLVNDLDQTLLTFQEDPEAFVEQVSAALDARADRLGCGDRDWGYRQMMMEVAAGEILTLGVGKLTKVAVLRTLAKTRIKLKALKTLRSKVTAAPNRWVGSKLSAEATQEAADSMAKRISSLRAGKNEAIEQVVHVGSRKTGWSVKNNRPPLSNSDVDIAVNDWPWLKGSRHEARVLKKMRERADEFEELTGLKVEIHLRSRYSKEQWAEYFGEYFD